MDLRMRKLTNRDCPTSCLSSMFACLFKRVKQVQTLHFHSPMLVILSCLTLGSFVHGILQAKIMEWVATGFLIQGIFTIQVLNLGLLPCRQILYHLSHYGSPNYKNLYFPSLTCSSLLLRKWYQYLQYLSSDISSSDQNLEGIHEPSISCIL